jgi:hypothetical protein
MQLQSQPTFIAIPYSLFVKFQQVVHSI